MTVNGLTKAVGFHGSFWVDPETLDLRRVELDADDIPLALKRSRVKLAIDYGLVAVGAGTFLLPQATEARVTTDLGLESRTMTRFSACHQFLAESSISFEERPVDQVAAETRTQAALPPRTILEVALATPIDRKTAAIGDLVRAEVRKEAKTRGGVVVPKGAVVEGRIVLLETRGSAPPTDALALRFTKIRIGASEIGLRASVVRCGTGYRAALGSLHSGGEALRYIDPRDPMRFWGGFLELPKGLALTLQTEAVAKR